MSTSVVGTFASLGQVPDRPSAPNASRVPLVTVAGAALSTTALIASTLASAETVVITTAIPAVAWSAVTATELQAAYKLAIGETQVTRVLNQGFAGIIMAGGGAGVTTYGILTAPATLVGQTFSVTRTADAAYTVIQWQ